LGIAIRLGSTNPRYDIDRDGRVDWDDLRIALHQLGRRCRR
jgi:Ca2+-binding EF-hand superfamily protein